MEFTENLSVQKYGFLTCWSSITWGLSGFSICEKFNHICEYVSASKLAIKHIKT